MQRACSTRRNALHEKNPLTITTPVDLINQSTSINQSIGRTILGAAGHSQSLRLRPRLNTNVSFPLPRYTILGNCSYLALLVCSKSDHPN